MIKAIALDDEPLALEILENYCSKASNIELLAVFTQVKTAEAFILTTKPDLIFLDIQMPNLSGLDFCALLAPETLVIFTTAYSEYAVQGFNLRAVDYLLKPYGLERFLLAVEKAKKEIYINRNKKEEKILDTLEIKTVEGKLYIPLKEIIYIESNDDYSTIHRQSTEPLIVKKSLKTLQDKLGGKAFIRIHRSYLVAISHIESIRNKFVYIKGTHLPIGASFEKEVLARLNL